jgi:hypothetical protein
VNQNSLTLQYISQLKSQQQPIAKSEELQKDILSMMKGRINENFIEVPESP